MSANVTSTESASIVPRLRLVQNQPASAAASDAGGGGDGPDDPEMRARVAALEASLQRIESSFAQFARDIGEIRQVGLDLKRDISGTLSSVADVKKELGDFRKEQIDQAKALSRVEGAVSKLPTNWQMILFVLAIMAFAFGRQFIGG